ncbi:hypothetical protein B5F10_11610 [Anaerotruncus colihominis]|uniref:DUF2634 domain-containing protein n=1 Tax=Anaerotruncus colihominis TaxID=169435 RepID=A0A1Y4MM90_9FIRM|nr:hypothetical protein [Anaerotruncus colihominis]OUP69848.1 hypothetical protein B5F11_07635 [Anaerotruncus colihominis]OUP73307.1 hypothetical protein B5F10_11610 [Anaerotruncus colihominis]
MDVLLENGDIVCGRDGTPVMIGGARELAQRAAIRLAVRRGSLAHDPSFGSELYRLPAAGGQAARDERALAYARRALTPLPQARVAAARSEWDAQNSRLAVRVTLDLGGGQAELEVRV